MSGNSNQGQLHLRGTSVRSCSLNTYFSLVSSCCEYQCLFYLLAEKKKATKPVASSRRPSFCSHLLMFCTTKLGTRVPGLPEAQSRITQQSQDKRNPRRARVHETAASLWERCCIFGWYKTIATSSRGGPSLGEVIPKGNRQHLLQTQNREP